MELFAKRMTWELDNDEGLSCLSLNWRMVTLHSPARPARKHSAWK